MKKTSFATILICLAGVMLLAGCKPSESGKADPEDKTESIGAASEEDAKDKDRDEKKSRKKKKKQRPDKWESIKSEPQDDKAGDRDYEALYAPVFDEILEVIDYGYNIDREYRYVSGGLSEKVMYSKDEDLLNSIGYLLTDMSGDGIPELLIGSDEEDDGRTYSYIYSLCSIKDEEPVCIISGSVRSSYNSIGDGHFYYEGSGGASITMFGIDHLSRDGSEIVWDDFYFTDEKENGTIGVYHNDTGIFDRDEAEEQDISEKEFAEKMEGYRDRCVTLSWTPIGQYKNGDAVKGSGDTGNDEQTGGDLSAAEGDPLEGLVSNDILTVFRGSVPVEYPGSLRKEANALGSWVQKSIGRLPKSIRDKGDRIGLSYEFWFGTDISNNLDNNFPRIYEAYYCLKDYYTSDGKRSSEYYENVSEENGYLGTGDPGSIEKMYKDMQVFITDCNNIIRGR